MGGGSPASGTHSAKHSRNVRYPPGARRGNQSLPFIANEKETGPKKRGGIATIPILRGEVFITSTERRDIKQKGKAADPVKRISSGGKSSSHSTARNGQLEGERLRPHTREEGGHHSTSKNYGGKAESHHARIREKGRIFGMQIENGISPRRR